VALVALALAVVTVRGARAERGGGPAGRPILRDMAGREVAVVTRCGG
jgi:hypothetical protein